MLVETPDMIICVIFAVFLSLNIWDVFKDRFKRYDNGLEMTDALSLMRTPGNSSSPAALFFLIFFILDLTNVTDT